MGLIHQRQTFRNNFIHFLQVCVVSYADLAGRYRSVAGTVLEIADVRVVDDLQVAARVLDRRRADADVANRASKVIQNDDIAVDVLPLKDDEGACDDILDQALRAETQDQADNADTSQHSSSIDAKDRESPDDTDDHDQIVERARQQITDRLGPHALLAKILNDPFDHHIDDPEHADHKEQCQNMGCRNSAAPLDQEIALFQITDLFPRLHRHGKPLRV